jgi:hypothetical protein
MANFTIDEDEYKDIIENLFGEDEDSDEEFAGFLNDELEVEGTDLDLHVDQPVGVHNEVEKQNIINIKQDHYCFKKILSQKKLCSCSNITYAQHGNMSQLSFVLQALFKFMNLAMTRIV